MSTASRIIIEAQDQMSRDDQLERATDLLRGLSTDCGILITRHSFSTFSARLSRDVDFGIIEELDLA